MDAGDAKLQRQSVEGVLHEARAVLGSLHLVVHLVQLALNLVRIADGDASAHREFQSGLRRSVSLVLCFEEEVSLLLLKVCLCKDEVKVDVLHLLHLKYIGVAVVVVLLESLLVIYITCIGDVRIDERQLHVAVEVSLLEVALQELHAHVVERERPTTELSSLCADDVLCTELERNARLVEEHVLGSEGKASVAVAVFLTHLHSLRELYAHLADVKAHPFLVVGADVSLALVITGGERSHVVVVHRCGVVVDNGARTECPARKSLSLEVVHGSACRPVVPVLDVSLDVQHGSLVRSGAVSHLLQLGNGDVDVDVQGSQRVSLPVDVASVRRCLTFVSHGDIGRSLKLNLETGRRFLHVYGGKQTHRSALRQQTVGADTCVRCTEDEDVVVRIAAFGQRERTDKVH